MLAKLSSIDLHPAAFPLGAAAATSIDHTSVNLWRDSDLPDGQAVFNLLVFATFAQSLWHTCSMPRRSMASMVRPPRGRPSLNEVSSCIGSFCSSPEFSRSAGPSA